MVVMGRSGVMGGSSVMDDGLELKNSTILRGIWLV